MLPVRLALLALLPSIAVAASQGGDALPSDERLLDVWSYLSPEEQREAIEYFRYECGRLASYQQGLIDYLLESLEQDPGSLPEGGPATFFDPEVHAPAQPIKRKWLDPDSRSVARRQEELLAATRDDLLERAYAYRWGTGQIERLADPDPLGRTFRNGLAGFPAEIDLAQALVEQRLDDGAQRQSLAAFAHAYTDRKGNVYPGITLYDAWCSGERLEMPDVDNLGLLHTLAGDWTSFVAPVPSKQHDELYSAVEAYFVPARRHRGLRQALARVYLRGSAVPEDLWFESLDRLHALWETHGADPATLAAGLPGVDDWERYLAEWGVECGTGTELHGRGVTRRQTLDRDRDEVRAALVRILKELGAFERSGPPRPSKAPRVDPQEGQPAGGELAELEDLSAYAKTLAGLEKLSAARRRTLLRAVEEALAGLEAPQVALVAALARTPLEKLPEAPEYAPHDPDRWGAGKRRRQAREGTSRWRTLERRIATGDPPRLLEARAVYDFGSGEVVRLPPDEVPPAAVFRNLLRGFPPNQDLAEAQLIAILDGEGNLRAEAEFFSHPYCDLDAYWYEGIALYDVWSREVPNEVPDEEVRAYAEKVQDETDLPAQLRGSYRNAWYQRIYDSALAYHRHRQVAAAVAAYWLQAEPRLPAGYVNARNYLQAWIAAIGADSGAAAERFSTDSFEFIEGVRLEIEADPELYVRGEERQTALRAGRLAVRAATLEVLAAEGYLAD